MNCEMGMETSDTKTYHGIGKTGEDFTVKYLESRGCVILERNYRRPGAEIDIIAELRGELHFVEVKTRRRDSLVSAPCSINFKKKRMMINAAARYLNEKCFDRTCVFDVALIEHDGGEITDFKYISRAFTASK